MSECAAMPPHRRALLWRLTLMRRRRRRTSTIYARSVGKTKYCLDIYFWGKLYILSVEWVLTIDSRVYRRDDSVRRSTLTSINLMTVLYICINKYKSAWVICGPNGHGMVAVASIRRLRVKARSICGLTLRRIRQSRLAYYGK